MPCAEALHACWTTFSPFSSLSPSTVPLLGRRFKVAKHSEALNGSLTSKLAGKREDPLKPGARAI